MKYKQLALAVSNENSNKLSKYVELIEGKNLVMNLTGFSGDRLWNEGIYESICSLSNLEIDGHLLDIGAGAGFPSIPFVIVNPNISLTIMEPKVKRISFLKEVSSTLGLDINFIISRAEDFKENSTFDFITARAVAPLYKLIEISFHLGHIGTKFIWVKGPNVRSEIEDASKIINRLKLELSIKEIKIDEKVISIISYVKKINTPKNIPRQWKDITL